MIRGAMKDRPVYVTGEIEPEFTAGLQRVPEGLAFRLVADSGFFETPFPELSYRTFQAVGKYEARVRQLYAGALRARAAYYGAAGRVEESRKALEAAQMHASGGYEGGTPARRQ